MEEESTTQLGLALQAEMVKRTRGHSEDTWEKAAVANTELARISSWASSATTQKQEGANKNAQKGMESRSSVLKVVKLRLVVNTERVQITLRKVFRYRHSKPLPVVLMQNCSSPKCYRLKITYARSSSKFKLCKFQKSLENLLFHLLHSKICLLNEELC